MSAKKLITKDMILKEAVFLLEEKGYNAINARELAKRLNCSTQPLYLTFKNMDELKNALIDECSKKYFEYANKQKEDSVFMQYLMSYIKFAKEKPHLFEYLYMINKHNDDNEKDLQFKEYIINKISELSNISKAKAEKFFLSSWFFTHGLACQIVTGYIDWNENIVRDFLNIEFKALKLYFKEE